MSAHHWVTASFFVIQTLSRDLSPVVFGTRPGQDAVFVPVNVPLYLLSFFNPLLKSFLTSFCHKYIFIGIIKNTPLSVNQGREVTSFEQSYLISSYETNGKITGNSAALRFFQTKKRLPPNGNKRSCIVLASTYSPGTSVQVPSALAGLTTLFGMGRGGSPPLKTPTCLYFTPLGGKILFFMIHPVVFNNRTIIMTND